MVNEKSGLYQRKIQIVFKFAADGAAIPCARILPRGRQMLCRPRFFYCNCTFKQSADARCSIDDILFGVGTPPGSMARFGIAMFYVVMAAIWLAALWFLFVTSGTALFPNL